MRLPTPAARLEARAYRLEVLAEQLGNRAAALLRPTAGGMRELAALYRQDPTLDGDLAGRERSLSLVAEYGRQLGPLVRNASGGRENPKWPIEARWAEAEAMVARMQVLLPVARAQVYDLTIPERSRELSALWLAAAHTDVAKAAARLRSAVRAAMSLPHPDPTAGELERLAVMVSAHAGLLADRRDEDLDRMHASMESVLNPDGRPGGADG